jgi:hypothetical protein
MAKSKGKSMTDFVKEIILESISNDNKNCKLEYQKRRELKEMGNDFYKDFAKKYFNIYRMNAADCKENGGIDNGTLLHFMEGCKEFEKGSDFENHLRLFKKLNNIKSKVVSYKVNNNWTSRRILIGLFIREGVK